MAKKHGRGVAAVNYPTGMNLGGDPSQALVHATTTGNFVVALSSTDLGQGLKTVMQQICAETIGVPPEMVIIDTADTDTGPHCMGTFASRGTHRIGNAIIMAAKEARQVLMDVAADELEVSAADLETDGKGVDPRQGRAVEVDSRSSRSRSPPTSNTARPSPAAASSCRPARSPIPRRGR